MNHVKLSEISEVGTGQSAPQDSSAFGTQGLPFVRAGSLERLVNGDPESNLERITHDAAKKYRMKVYPPETIVFAKSGMSSKIGRVYRLKRKCHVVSHLATIIPGKNVSPEYLLRWFEANSPAKLIDNDAYPSIKTSTIKGLTVDLPSLEEQKRIAAILDAADALRAKRRKSIEQLDTLLQSTFLEMFGDPIANPKKWKMGVIGDLLESANYGTSKKASLETGQFPVLRMNNITYSGGWDFKSIKYLDLDEKEKSKYMVHKGQLLFNRTNSKELVGKTAVYRRNEPMAFAGYLVRGVVNSTADAEFIGAFMNTPMIKQFLQSKCKNIVGMANINAKEFQAIPIPMPPISLQQRFARMVEAIEKQRAELKNHLSMLDILFASLQSRAFQGDL